MERGEATIRRAIVFPGQGTGGGEVSGRVWEVVRAHVGDEETPYQLSVFASSVDLLYQLRDRGVEPDILWGSMPPRMRRGVSGWRTRSGLWRRGTA